MPGAALTALSCCTGESHHKGRCRLSVIRPIKYASSLQTQPEPARRASCSQLTPGPLVSHTDGGLKQNAPRLLLWLMTGRAHLR